MTIAEGLTRATEKLKKQRISSPRLDAELLLGNILHLSREELYAHPSQTLTAKQIRIYKSLVRKRLTHFPLAYLTGKKEFMGLEFLVNKDVLIPRPETELLVETILDHSPLTTHHSPIFVDLGTGCGNIAVSLAKYIPGCFIYAIDNSRKALELAKRNAKFHKVDDQIKFLPGDLFSPLQKYKLEREIDTVVSNPPYVCSRQKRGQLSFSCSPEIRYEPRKALDGGGDGLKYYPEITSQTREWLKPGGLLALEIGKGQSRKVISLMKSAGYNPIKTYKDYANINRVVVGKMGSTLFFGEKES